MKKRKTFITTVCIILVALMLLSIVVMVAAPLAYASSSSEIQDELDDLNSQKYAIQGRMNDIQEQIDSLDYQKSNTLEKKLILDQKNELARQEIQVIDEQIAIIDNQIATLQKDLADARQEEELQRERWQQRVRAMEESSDIGYIQVLFEATSYSDLLTRLDLVNEILVYDEELERQYVAARERVETLEAEAEAKFAENEIRRQEQQDRRDRLQADIDAACLLMASMDTSIEDKEEVMAQEAETLAQTQALIVEKNKELQEAKAAEEAERQRKLAEQQAAQQQAAGAGPVQGSAASGTWMMWPTYTHVINSYYGMRTDPVSGVIYRLHAGVDVNSAYGTAIWSAAAGTVIHAGWNGGYGNCVMVNHGNGYTTLYGHMSSIAVSYGQSVAMGQVLGYVGSTGNSTGPHLHFEIRSSYTGGSINPLGFSYLT